MRGKFLIAKIRNIYIAKYALGVEVRKGADLLSEVYNIVINKNKWQWLNLKSPRANMSVSLCLGAIIPKRGYVSDVSEETMRA